MQNTDRYTVVENAGYERENDIRSFPTIRQALAYVERQYSADERDIMSDDCLHVAIRLDKADGSSTYEL